MERDRLTIVSLAVIAYALATVVHEGVGHGGACVLSGGKPELTTSMQFQGDDRGLSTAAVKFIAAGGPIANLILAAAAVMLLGRRADATWFFLWLTASINLMVAAGYPLYSGVANRPPFNFGGQYVGLGRSGRPGYDGSIILVRTSG